MTRLVVEAGWMAEPGGRLRRDTAVVIEYGRIAGIEPVGAIEGVEADERLGGPEILALPGLVNAHQHGRPDSTVARGIPDAPLECWLASLFAAPAGDPYADTLAVCRRLLAGGVTTAAHAHYTAAGTGEEYEDDLRAVLAGYRDGGVRGIVAADLRDRGLPVYEDEDAFLARLPDDLRTGLTSLLPPPFPLEEAFEVVEGLRADARSGRLGEVDVVYGPPGPPWCSEALFASVAERSAATGAAVHTHLLESVHERDFGLRSYPGGTVASLRRLGLMTERLAIAHGVWLDQAECEALAAAGASVVTNPGSNLRLHAGVAPVQELVAAGVNVAIGTDSMALDDRDELLDELRLVRALQRHPGVDKQGLDTRTLLSIATENGARALGRADVGALRPGASGDVVMIDLRRLGTPTGSVDALELALATARPTEIAAVVARGRVLAREGEPLAPAPDRQVARIDAERAELIARLAPFVRAHYRSLGAGAVGVDAWERTCLAVNDLGCALAFYRAAFGYEPVFEARGMRDQIESITGRPGLECDLARLRSPRSDHVLELIEFRHGPVPAAHVAFTVPDLERALREVERLGAERLGEVTAFVEGRAVYCQEPAGSIFELSERFE